MAFTSAVDAVFGNSVGDSILILGDIVFGHLEIPENFNFGGNQMMHVHKLVGGARVIDTMGRDDHDITWSGLFFGESAAERARALDFLRVQGNIIELIFGEFIYTVVIKSFSPSFERYYQVPYSITLTIVENLTIPVPFAVPNGYNDAVNNDLQAIIGLLGAANSTALTEAVGNLTKSIAAGGNLSAATPDQLNDIKSNIETCQAINNNNINFATVNP